MTLGDGYHVGDCRELLRRPPDGCVQTCVTSPPYWGLRDYGADGQLGLEATPDEYVANMVEVLREEEARSNRAVARRARELDKARRDPRSFLWRGRARSHQRGGKLP